jgi:hypothetical protein
MTLLGEFVEVATGKGSDDLDRVSTQQQGRSGLGIDPSSKR